MDIAVWLALVGMFFAGGLTPGPAVMLVMSSSLRYGLKPALLPAIGISTANVVWILLAASGTAALATAFPMVFLGLKIAGLCFIAWLAWSLATADPNQKRASANKAPPRAHLFAKGVGLQLANPNALVFFGLLLPQFIDGDRSLSQQIALILATITVTEMLGLTVYAWLADTMNQRFQSESFSRRFNRLAAALMLGSAIIAVWATSSAS
jgi:threonine/homoserine/homoserine lactone efflux protein